MASGDIIRIGGKGSLLMKYPNTHYYLGNKSVTGTLANTLSINGEGCLLVGLTKGGSSCWSHIEIWVDGVRYIGTNAKYSSGSYIGGILCSKLADSYYSEVNEYKRGETRVTLSPFYYDDSKYSTIVDRILTPLEFKSNVTIKLKSESGGTGSVGLEYLILTK